VIHLIHQALANHQLMVAVTIVVGYLVYLCVAMFFICRASDRQRALDKAAKQAIAMHGLDQHSEVHDICSDF
jgi:hypothetical protein